MGHSLCCTQSCAQANCTDGSYPSASLVQAPDGNFYGTTYYGGTATCGIGGCGTVFKMTPNGSLTTLYRFASGGESDGAYPYSPLVQVNDGNFYGTTQGGGSLQYGGTIFQSPPPAH